MRVSDPEAVAFERDVHARERCELENSPQILDILQREEVHVTVIWVICGKKAFECLMFPIMRIAIAGRMRVLEPKPRFARNVRKCVSTLCDKHPGALIQPRRI